MLLCKVACERHDQVSAADERLLVRRRHQLAALERREGRHEAHDARRANEDEIDLGDGRHLGERLRPVLGQGRVSRPIASDLLAERVLVAARGQGDHLEPVAVRLEDVERLPPDRARAPQHRDPDPVAHSMPCPAYASTSSVRYIDGAANKNESTRSRKPPCPGISVPESFAPAARFSIDSTRSPACALTAITRPRMTPTTGATSNRRTTTSVVHTTIAATVPPIAPLHVFLG